jgi:hypothetical protein
VVGQVLSTNLASGTFQVFLLGPGSVAPAQALGSSSSPTLAGLTLGSPLSLSSGGTGASLTGTTGGVPYFSSSAAMGSSAALTANTLIKGGAPSAPSSGSITDTGTAYTFSPGTVASGTQTIFTLTGPASSGLSNTNSQDVNLNLSRTVTFAGGAGSFTPVGVLIGAPTYAASLAQTFSPLATLAITGPPACSGAVALVTCLFPRGLWVESANVRVSGATVHDAIAAEFDAPTGTTFNSWALSANGLSCLGPSCTATIGSTTPGGSVVVYDGTATTGADHA